MKLQKHFLLIALATVTLFSCKKETSAPEAEHTPEAYRVLAVGKAQGDTSISSSMWARVETVGLIVAEDSKLRAELIGYQKTNGQGVYKVAVTNKQSCQVILRWSWEGLTLDSISPAGAQGDVIPANGYKVYTLIGDAKVGKIKVKAQGVDCGNSSTLIIDITLGVLPIIFLENKIRDGKVLFTVDSPSTINWFIIQKLQADKTWAQIALVPADDQTKSYSVPLFNK